MHPFGPPTLDTGVLTKVLLENRANAEAVDEVELLMGSR